MGNQAANKRLDAMVSGGRSRSPGCPVCGESTVAMVSVMIRKLGEHGEPKGAARSRQRSFCAEHALQIWEEVHARIETPA